MTTRPPQRRRRSEELDDAIKVAVLDEIAERGYQGLTFEGVARRLGTSKPVLYRRYRTRADMAIDAFLSSRTSTPPARFDGPLRANLIALVRGVLDRIGHDGVQVFRGILGEVDDQTVGRVASLVLSRFEGWLETIVEHGRDAGELGAREVSPAVVRAVIALVRNEVLFVYGAGHDGDVEALVDDVLLPLLRDATSD